MKNHSILRKLIMFFFYCLNHCNDIIICVYCFELFPKVSTVVHGPLVQIPGYSDRIFSSLPRDHICFLTLHHN